MYFDEEICFFNKKMDNREEALEFLAKEFLEKELVTNLFYKGISEREKLFPTGLNINEIGFAIPHTDSDKVKRSQVGFLSLEESVEFKEMTDMDECVGVKLIFMLALKEPHEQLEMLQRLMELFQNEKLVKRLLECCDKESYLKIIEEAGLK